MTTSVRSARLDDLGPLANAVVLQPLLLRYGSTADGLRRHLEAALAAGEGLLVAGTEGRPIGFAWFQLGAALGLGGYLKLIAPVPGAESRGVGGALLDEVERTVAAAARTRLLLLVSDFNEGAQRFYEHRGYLRAGRLEGVV